ncbi:hypothetical protein BJV78DRAFT_1158492 [Lactifluus subvellereus]|nr:hypothetical protein BJV78DRAFT_1158492 [Lactifluus subvellereus]
MSFPDPQQAPIAFSDYLKAENLNVCLAVFGLYQTQPRKASNDRLDETKVTGWPNSLTRRATIPSTPDLQHSQGPVLTGHGRYGWSALDTKGADTAAKQKREEEEHARQEQEERRHWRRLRGGWKAGTRMKTRQQQQGEQNDGSESLADQQEDTKKLTKRQLDQLEVQQKLPQVTHKTPCQLCQKSGEKSLSRSRGGGEGGAGHPFCIGAPEVQGTHFCQRWSPLVAWPARAHDEASASTHSVGKHARTSTNSSNVRFDGVVIQKPTRRSMRVTKATTALRNDVAHVCRHIGQELGVVAQSFSDFADAFK